MSKTGRKFKQLSTKVVANSFSRHAMQLLLQLPQII